MTYFQAIANELQEAIDRVKALHTPVASGWESPFKPDTICCNCIQAYPCSTLKALETPNEVQ